MSSYYVEFLPVAAFETSKSQRKSQECVYKVRCTCETNPSKTLVTFM